MSNAPRILIYDIETTHNIVASFDLNTEYLPHDNIIQERFIVSVAWSWLGEHAIHTCSVLDDPKRFAKNSADDYVVCKKLHQLFEECDASVAHNGDSFDYKMVQGRLIKHGFKPTPPHTQIDTKKIATGRFRFNSNRLDYLCKYLGFGGKIHTDNSLWLKVLKGDRAAIQMMVKYNKHDIVLLKQLFVTLAPYLANHISRQLFDGKKTGCPRCGSTKVQARGIHRAISRNYQRWQCQSCGGWYKTAKPEGVATKTRTL